MAREDTSAKKENNRNVPLGRTSDRPIWGLWLSICVRAVHQLGVAAVLGFLFFSKEELSGSLLLFAAGSGLLLCFTEGARHREMYREFSGVVTFAKCILLGFGVHHVLPQLPVFILVFFMAALAAHAPKQVRHRLMW